MALLEVSELTMSYPDKPLYSDAEFQVNKGEHIGIVGQNGAGKSTLIKILTNQVLPVSGRIDWQKNIKIGYLDQYADIPENSTLEGFLHTAYADLYKTEAAMTNLYTKYAETMDDKLLERASRMQEELDAADFYSIDQKVEQIITGLGLNAIGRDHIINEMSGGQRAKIILAKLLLEDNDIIILDEPTNYLDVAHIEWLENYLQSYEGAALVISHDFDFLDAVTNAILDVSFGKITKYRGNFKQAMRTKDERTEQQIKQYEKQQEVIAKTEKFIAKNKARASTAKMARGRQKMLDRMEVLERPEENPRATFDFPYVESASMEAVKTNQLVVGYEKDHPILNPITFQMSAGDKVAFAGFNGAGKSTLIKTILGYLTPLSGKFSFSPSAKANYFSQDLVWDNERQTPLQIMQQAFPKEEGKTLRNRLGRAGINGTNAMKEIGLLSGGEQTKVKLALMELIESNFLILDEPTNHLDETTKQALKKALIKFPGSVIIVSHEPGFYDGLVDQVVDIASISNQTPSDEGL
ncbi:MAG: ATP-binding cassette domain-containing protein [Lactobacillaceae bacterium]|jgi:ATPase subunit of ABC transporter with duplicated ATPase domains|nr:ATP-binding cassette domain-containing protein [Lactobacillaceae bacterium]